MTGSTNAIWYLPCVSENNFQLEIYQTLMFILLIPATICLSAFPSALRFLFTPTTGASVPLEFSSLFLCDDLDAALLFVLFSDVNRPKHRRGVTKGRARACA